MKGEITKESQLMDVLYRVPGLLALAWIAFCPCVLLAEEAEAPLGPLETEKGRGPDSQGWAPYVELLELKYLPPAQAGAPSTVRSKFNISLEIPKGAVISFTLEFMGLDFDSTDYTLKDENRKNLSLDWKLSKRFASGDYYLRSRLYLEKQPPEVRRAIEKQDKRFPKGSAPWPYLFMNEELKMVVGDSNSEVQDKEELCKIYGAFMDELIDSMNEFVRKMEDTKQGKELAAGGTLDLKGFEEYVTQWRTKQGEIQFRIAEFESKEIALFMKSQTAYANLRELSKMVAKRARQVQDEVTKQYNQKIFNPAIRYFDAGYRFRVTKETLQQKYERILSLVCPEEEAEGEGEKAAGEAKPGEEAQTEGAKPEAEARPPSEAEQPKETGEEAKSGEGETQGESEAGEESPKPEEKPTAEAKSSKDSKKKSSSSSKKKSGSKK